MNSYLLINVVLTVAALAINHYMKIPHRTRFYIMLTAVIAWLIPFSLITIELPNQAMAVIPVQLNQLTVALIDTQPVLQTGYSLMTVIYILLSLGLFRFLIDLLKTKKYINNLKILSKPYLNHSNIRLTQGIHGAFVSGYFKPVIWIDEKFQNAETLPSVIAHEKQHIRSHDQFGLFVIVLVQRLFWFNPLSLLLCRQCKNSIELSCDEACKKQLGHKQYQSHLAQLIIGQQHKNLPLMNNQIHQNKQFNVHRVKQLDQENIMTKSKTIQLALMGISILATSIASFTTVASNDKLTQIQDNEVLLGINWKVTKYNDDSSSSSELNSEIIVNNQEFKTFEFADFEFKVKHIKATQVKTQKLILSIPKLLVKPIFQLKNQ